MNKYIIYIFVAIANIVFASLLVRIGQTGPLAAGSYRLLLAIPLLLLLDYSKSANHKTTQKLNWRYEGLALLAGVFFAGDLAFYNLSLTKTSLAEANLLTNMTPFIITPLSALLFRERLNLKFVQALLLASFGLYVLMDHVSLSHDHKIGNYFSLASAVFYSFFLITIKTVANQASASLIMRRVSVSGGLILLALAVFHHEQILPTTAFGWFILVMIAVCGQLLGQTLLAFCLQIVSLQLASIILLSSPIIAAIYGFIFFHEHLSQSQMIGMMLLLASIYLAKKSQDNQD